MEEKQLCLDKVNLMCSFILMISLISVLCNTHYQIDLDKIENKESSLLDGNSIQPAGPREREAYVKLIK